MKSPDSKYQQQKKHQANEFEMKTRQALISGVLTVYGTADQANATLEKMREELSLQGIDFNIDRVEWD